MCTLEILEKLFYSYWNTAGVDVLQLCSIYHLTVAESTSVSEKFSIGLNKTLQQQQRNSTTVAYDSRTGMNYIPTV